MIRTASFRRILWAAAAFNVFGACLLGFPDSTAGQMSGLPADVPLFYRCIVTVFVLLFAGAYAWLALQPEPNRPMVVLALLGKAAVFAVVMILWLAGEITFSSIPGASGDLVFVLLFAAWLKRSEEPTPAAA